MTAHAVPTVAETRPAILKKLKPKQLDAELEKMRQKYKGFGEDLIHWMIATNNNIEVADIKAGSDGGEGEEISIAQFEAHTEDEDVLEGWTHVTDGGVFNKPKGKPAKYSLPTAAIVDIIRGETKNGEKLDLVVSDGTGTTKVVCYAKAVDLVREAKIRVGDVVRLPLLSAQYGHWTKKGQKGQDDEEVLWYKFSLPQFGSIHKLDLPVTQFLKNLDQVVVKAKDACFVDGIVTSLDPQTNDICTKCFQWYDEKKPEKHAKCKGAEIAEEVGYVGTMTTTSSQIHKLMWVANPRQGTFEAKKPKFNVASDVLRVFGTLTEKNTVMVSVFTVIDSDDIQETPEEAPAPKTVKASVKGPVKGRTATATITDDDGEEDDEEDVAPAPKPKRSLVPVPADDEEEDEEDEDEDDDAPSPPPRRVLRKAAPVPEPEEDEEDEEEAPAPRRAVRKPVQEPEEDEDEEETPPTPLRRRAKAPVPEPDEEDDDENGPSDGGVVDAEDEPVVAAPVRRRVAKAAPVEPDEGTEEEDEDEEVVIKAASKIPAAKAKPKANGSAGKVTDFIVQALTNFGGPQRSYIIGRSAAKKGFVQCDDLDDTEAVKDAFQPHLEAAIESGAIKYADDKQTKIWLAKGA